MGLSGQILQFRTNPNFRKQYWK